VLPPFGDKTVGVQFVAHTVLFLIGFAPIWLRWRQPLDEDTLVKSTLAALMLHGVFLAIDGVALIIDSPRPFEDSFLGSAGRLFPTGLFSEPSYVAAYVGILLPVVLFRASVARIFIVSVAVGGIFFLGDVRSFFVVYTAGLLVLILARWGLTVRVMIAAAVTLAVVATAAVSLSLLSVEDSLSSAYRFGNALSYFDYAISHNILLGDGFGSAHFLYPQLDFPDFMYLSREFNNMLDGSGNRVPVFNLWVRLFVELGILPTLLLLAWILRRWAAGRRPAVAKIYAAAVLVCSLSTDSYIYGMFTLGLMLLFSLQIRERRLSSRHAPSGQVAPRRVLTRRARVPGG
jgi:hypothetical protein